MNMPKWIRGTMCALLSILIFQCGIITALADVSAAGEKSVAEAADVADERDGEAALDTEESGSEDTAEDDVKVPILLYHNITPGSGGGDIANVSAKMFETHILALINAGYNIISLKDYISYVKGEGKLPKKPLVLTFDDGYSSNYEIAFPILKRYNIPATIFIVTGTVGERAEDGKVNNSHFTWRQAALMQASGLVDIESHTLTHPNLPEKNVSDIQKELRKSKYMIEKWLGKECKIIAFPYGGYNEKLVPLAAAAGYESAVLVDDKLSADPSYANTKADGLYSIKRLTISGDVTSAHLLQMIKNTVGE